MQAYTTRIDELESKTVKTHQECYAKSRSCTSATRGHRTSSSPNCLLATADFIREITSFLSVTFIFSEPFSTNPSNNSIVCKGGALASKSLITSQCIVSTISVKHIMYLIYRLIITNDNLTRVQPHPDELLSTLEELPGK